MPRQHPIGCSKEQRKVGRGVLILSAQFGTRRWGIVEVIIIY